MKRKITWDGEGYTKYSYHYASERFERPIRKSYRISVHESYRENGKVKKKQTVICTIGYYEVVDWGDWPGDFVVGGLASKADALGLEESETGRPDLYKVAGCKMEKYLYQMYIL